MAETAQPIPESIGVLETETIHAGFRTVDIMVKMAPVRILAASPVPPGRFLIIVGGGVGEVESSFRRGVEIAGPLHDRLFLPEIDPAVLAAVRGPASPGPIDSLGLYETLSVSAGLDAADKGVKGSATRLLQIHLTRGIHGKSYGLFSGRQDAVEAALAIAEERASSHDAWVGSTLLARPDAAVSDGLITRPWGFLEGQEIL